MAEEEPTLDPQFGRILSAEEMEPTYMVPSLSVNRWFIQPTSSGIRLAFGETAAGTPNIYWRVAITLAPQDAVRLYKLLQHMVRPFDETQSTKEGVSEAQKDV